MLEALSRHGKLYAQQKYEAWLSCAQDAEFTDIWMVAYFSTIQRYASIVQFLDAEIKVVEF
jgi:transposase